ELPGHAGRGGTAPSVEHRLRRDADTGRAHWGRRRIPGAHAAQRHGLPERPRTAGARAVRHVGRPARLPDPQLPPGCPASGGGTGNRPGSGGDERHVQIEAAGRAAAFVGPPARPPLSRVAHGRTSPRLSAMQRAWVRSRAPSFSRMLFTWALTVPSTIASSRPISSLVIPRAISPSTSPCRLVSRGRVTWLASLAATAGGKHAPPRCTATIASATSAG